MSWGNPVHSNPRTNQLTEKKHSKRKEPYRPLERTEPLKRKAWWKTEAQSVKRSTQKKKEHSQVSNQWEQKPLWLRTRSWVEEGLRECHTKNQSQEIGDLQSAKKKKKRQELGRRGRRNSQKKQHQGEKGALEKEQHNHEKELGKFFKKPKKKP